MRVIRLQRILSDQRGSEGAENPASGDLWNIDSRRFRASHFQLQVGSLQPGYSRGELLHLALALFRKRRVAL